MLAWLANNPSGFLAEMLIRVPNSRAQFIVIVLPLLLLLGSPHIVSNGVNTQRYGNNRIIVSSHVRAQLAICCINPFSGDANNH
jgi:hypothetical protein